MRIRSTVLLSFMAVLTAALAIGRDGHAATINWKGHTWNVTAGGMAGVCQGNAANISIDSDGYLHLKITNNGGTWTAAEIFTTDKIGFGTYQWQIDGPVDKLDKNVVVGLYPYGPEAGIGSDGQNEIDIEYARWGNASYPNGNYTVYPPTGTGSSEITFDFTLTGTYTTSRFAWSSTKIDFVTMSGFEPLGSTAGLIKAWTFSPASPATQGPAASAAARHEPVVFPGRAVKRAERRDHRQGLHVRAAWERRSMQGWATAAQRAVPAEQAGPAARAARAARADQGEPTRRPAAGGPRERRDLVAQAGTAGCRGRVVAWGPAARLAVEGRSPAVQPGQERMQARGAPQAIRRAER